MGGLATVAAGHVTTEAARAAAWDKFLDQVDPARALAPAERQRRAEAARRLHMTRLALRSSQARSKKKAGPVRDAGPAWVTEGNNDARPSS